MSFELKFMITALILWVVFATIGNYTKSPLSKLTGHDFDPWYCNVAYIISALSMVGAIVSGLLAVWWA